MAGPACATRAGKIVEIVFIPLLRMFTSCCTERRSPVLRSVILSLRVLKNSGGTLLLQSLLHPEDKGTRLHSLS